MNYISTHDDTWLDACESWARKNEPFELRDFWKSSDDLFADYLCHKYRYAWKANERTAVFTPLYPEGGEASGVQAASVPNFATTLADDATRRASSSMLSRPVSIPSEVSQEAETQSFFRCSSQRRKVDDFKLENSVTGFTL